MPLRMGVVPVPVAETTPRAAKERKLLVADRKSRRHRRNSSENAMFSFAATPGGEIRFTSRIGKFDSRNVFQHWWIRLDEENSTAKHSQCDRT